MVLLTALSALWREPYDERFRLIWAVGRDSRSAGRARRIRLALVAPAGLAVMAAQAQTYTASVLPGLGGTSGIVTGLNSSGVVVGFADTAGHQVHAALWSGSTVNDLGTLGGTSSHASAVNDSGQVSGYSRTAGDGVIAATLFSSSGQSDLGILGDGQWSYAYAINATGHIVGASTTTAGVDHYMHATHWYGGQIIDLGTLGGVTGSPRGSSATAINAAGIIVGFSDTPSGGAPHAVRWNGTVATDLGTLGGHSSAAFGINTDGLVVGQSDVAGDAALHATLWAGTTVTDLGTLGGHNSMALGINSAGQIVGTSQVSDNGKHAALWSGGKIMDFNALVTGGLPATVTLTVAVAINDSGQVGAYGDDTQTGGTVAVLLTPARR